MSHTEQTGNFTRYTHHNAEFNPVDAPPPPEQNRVYQGAIRMGHDGSVSQAGITQYAAGQSKAITGIASTRQSMNGQITVELEPGNPASRTSINTAIRDGLVIDMGNGVFTDALGQAPQAPTAARAVAAPPTPQAAPAEAAEVPFSYLPEAELADWQADTEQLSQHGFDAAVAGTISRIAAGNSDFNHVARSLAESEGISIELATEYVEQGSTWYQEALSKDLMKTAGLQKDSLPAFYEFAKESPKLRQALSQLMHEGSPATFRQLATEFKRESAATIDTAPFRAAGWETMVDRATGNLMVRRPGGQWMRPSTGPHS